MEQRQAQRVDFEVAVDFESEHNFFTGFVRNISDGGLFIATANPSPIGARVTVRLQIPALDEGVTISGIVKWVRPVPKKKTDLPGGMGLAFTDLSPELARKIDEFINQHESIFFDGD